jgi:hypothetical protein
MEVNLTCSANPKPSVQRGCKGHAGWGRDVFHVQQSGMSTLCGRDCSEWLRIGPREATDALADRHICSRCAAALKQRT